MNLVNIISTGRAIFVSHFINFNQVLSLHIAKNLVSISPVYIVSKYDFPPILLDTLDQQSIEKISIYRSLPKTLRDGTVLIIISDEIDIESIKSICPSHNFFMFTFKLSIPKKACKYHLYKVAKVGNSLYSIRSLEGDVLLVRCNGGSIEEVELPVDIQILIEELKDLTNALGSVKAYYFVKYLSKKYGYSREKCLELVRRAIAMGLIIYSGGYLLVR
uniref:Uncharacterized protein n=1 Tax=Ignisphaera aggregans TaxID=334771 RepID=A0A7C2ZRI2_9CREN